MSTFFDKTRGKWRGILVQLGADPRVLNGKHHACPFCGGKDRFRFDDKQGSGSWICSSCGAGYGGDFLMRTKGWEFREMADTVEAVLGSVKSDPIKKPAKPEILKRRLQRMWEASKPVTRGDPVSQWLTNRVGSTLISSSLRYAESLAYAGDPVTYHPAMLAKVMGPDGRPATIHRTYLTTDGQKAPVEDCRRLMPGDFPAGSAVRLFQPKDGRLAVAEGIETALSVHRIAGVPCWSLLTAGNMKQFTVPDGVEELFVFGDNDAKFAGQAAAYTLGARYAGKPDMRVHVIIPDRVGQDWNDVLMRQFKKSSTDPVA